MKTRFDGNGADRAAGFILARHPQKPDLIVAASIDDGIWLSEDNGENWKNTGLKGKIYPTDIRFDISNGDHIWLCATKWQWKNNIRPSGFYRSSDCGNSWEKLSDESPTEIVQDISDPKIIYGIFSYAEIRRSFDGGQTWQNFSEGLPVNKSKAGEPAGQHRFSALAAGPDFILTASARGKFYRLNKNSDKWEAIKIEGVDQNDWFGAEKNRHQGEFSMFGAALGSITISPHNPKHWFFTDWFAVYQSKDEGKNWRLTVKGLEATVIHEVKRDYDSQEIIHLGMADNGYFRSTDNGKTWRKIRLPGNSGNIRSICSAAGGKLWALGANSSGHKWFSNHVYISEDSGLTWRRSKMQGLPEVDKYRCNSIAVHPKDISKLYLAVSGKVEKGKGGVYVSNDGGDTWEWDSEGIPPIEFFRERIWGNGKFIAIDANGNMLAISRDLNRIAYRQAGEKWQIANFADGSVEPASIEHDPFTPGRFYLAARQNGVYQSDDNGKTWIKIFEDKATAMIAVDQSHNGRIAVYGTGTHISYDGGKTWMPFGDQDINLGQGETLTFGKNALIGGSAGNGSFWAEISE